MSRRGELVVPRRALRGVRVRTAGGRHSHRLRSWIPAGGLRSHLLPRQDVTGSVWQGWVRGPDTVSHHAPHGQGRVTFYGMLSSCWQLIMSHVKQYSSSLCLEKFSDLDFVGSVTSGIVKVYFHGCLLHLYLLILCGQALIKHTELLDMLNVSKDWI